jgi:hypothetical protein
MLYREKEKAWNRELPLLAMALHSMMNRQTGYIPNRLMLGRDTVQPIHILLGTTQERMERFDPESWIARLTESLQEVHKQARDNLRVAQFRQKRDYDMRLVEHQYHAGDLVYKVDSSTKIGQSKKLRSPWMGPFLVVDSHFSLYKIRNQKGNSVIHHDRLKRCSDRDIPITMRRLRHHFFNQDGEQEASSLRSGVSGVSKLDLEETMPYVEADSDACLLPGYGEDLQEMLQEVGDCDAVSLGTEET